MLVKWVMNVTAAGNMQEFVNGSLKVFLSKIVLFLLSSSVGFYKQIE